MGCEKTAMLTLYPRHSAKCTVHTLKLSPAAKRKFMACDCPLWIYGNTETTHVPRQSTGTNLIAVAGPTAGASEERPRPKGPRATHRRLHRALQRITQRGTRRKD